MGIRETLNEKPAIAYGGFGILLLIAIGILVLYMRSGAKGPNLEKPVGDQAFYSDDNGKTYFPDAAQKATPFKHDGKDAVRALVYQCSDGKPFVGCLLRHTDLGRLQKGLQLDIGNRPQFADHALCEAKKPTDAAWLPVETKNMAKVTDVLSVTCKTNANEVPQPVYPTQP